jgi:hypothetical protein
MLSRTLRNTLVAAVAVAAFTLVTVTPASAITYTRSCGVNSFDIGVVSNGAYADDRWHGDCGTVAVRARYNLPNGVTTYTSWVTASSFANVYTPSTATVLSADARGGNYTYYTLKRL